MSWNITYQAILSGVLRRPPCEVVSWNNHARSQGLSVIMSTSLWGRELKFSAQAFRQKERRRPPCEVVSWNVIGCYKKMADYCRPPCEVVSWNTPIVNDSNIDNGRPPCEVVSWNVYSGYYVGEGVSSTSLWGRELKYNNSVLLLQNLLSTSLWGRELKCI